MVRRVARQVGAVTAGVLCGLAVWSFPGCFGPVGVVGELDGTELPRLKHAFFAELSFGASADSSSVWVVIGDDAGLCDVIAARAANGEPCFDGWDGGNRLHLRLPAVPEGPHAVEPGACFSAFDPPPDAAICFEGPDGMGLSGFGGSSADGGSVAVSRWVQLNTVEGRLDVTFPDGWALGSFRASYCGELNFCCNAMGCF